MKNKGFRTVKGLLAAYLFVTVALPLLLLIGHIRLEDIRAVLSSALFLPMLGNSLATTMIAAVISVSLSFCLRYVFTVPEYGSKQFGAFSSPSPC